MLLMDSRVWVFATLAIVLTLTPGADTALTVRSTLARGRTAALLTVAGICLGCLLHATASAFGLSLLLSQSAAAFETVKIAGAAYLAWLGFQSLRAAFRGQGSMMFSATEQPQRRAWVSFSEGLFTNLLNPKMPLFYLTLLPQFVTTDGGVFAQSMLFGSIHAVTGFVYLGGCALFLDKVSGVILKDRFRQRLEAVTGVVLMSLGVRMALQER